MTSTVQAYDHLSHLLGSAIVHEEKKYEIATIAANVVFHVCMESTRIYTCLYRCGYLQTEIKTLLQSLEDMDIPDPSDGTLNCRSFTNIHNVFSIYTEALLHRSSLAMSLHDVLCW